MLQFPQLFFHLKPETNVILQLKFWRISNPFWNYSLSWNCWDTLLFPCPLIVGVQDLHWWVPCDKQHWKNEEMGQKQKHRVEVSQLFLSEIVAPHYLLRRIKTEFTRTLSNFDFQWTKILYQNDLKDNAFFLTFFKG